MVAASTKPTIILFGGGWHRPFHARQCIASFEAAGYRAVCHELLNNTDTEKSVTWEEEVSGLTSLVEHESSAGQQVVLIAHSVSGTVCTEALNQLFASAASPEDVQRKVARLIFATSFFDFAVRPKRDSERGWLVVNPDEGTLYCRDTGRWFYNDMSAEAAQPFLNALAPKMMLWKGGPAVTSDKWMQIPRTYIRCNQDLTIEPWEQDEVIEAGSFEVVEMDAGHCPYVSQPNKFAEIVDGVVRG